VAALQAQLADMREDSETLRRARDDLARQLQLQLQPNAATAADARPVSALELADRRQKAAAEPQRSAVQVRRLAASLALQ
jgi:hypothetical protein